MHCLINKSDFSSRDAEQSTRAEKPGEATNEIARTPTPDLTFFLCACSFIVLCEIDMNLCTIVQHEREAISGAPRKVFAHNSAPAVCGERAFSTICFSKSLFDRRTRFTVFPRGELGVRDGRRLRKGV